MATFSLGEDEKDFLVCGICLEVYDEQDRMPKLLQCHHTCCLACLKSQTKKKNEKSIDCPYCRQSSNLKNMQPDQLTTNFYILPKVHMLTSLRTRYNECRQKSQDNWAQAIALRRNVESKLKNVHDACRLLENLILQKAEGNNEKIVILQSLIEVPPRVEIEDLMSSAFNNWEEEVERSNSELSNARELSDSFSSVEKYACELVLQGQSGQKFALKNLYKQPISFSCSSSHGPHVGAAQSIFSYIIHHLTECSQLRPIESVQSEEGAPVHIEPSEIDSRSSLNASDNPSLKAYLQFRVNGIVKPIVIIQLDMQAAPLMGQTFLDYCRGVDNMTYKGTKIRKNGDSITGGKFNELKPLKGKAKNEKEVRYMADWSRLEEVKGAVRMRFRGKNGQGVLAGSEFSIICGAEHHNTDQITTVFGVVVQGMDVCEEISKMDTSVADVVIAACGPWPIVN